MIKNLKGNMAVGGYDVVSYFQDGPKKGDKNLSAEHEGAVYRFSTEENKKVFTENPEKYMPAYGGFCAIAMSEGSVVDAHPKAYIIQEGRLLMFFALTDFLFSDTRKQWRKKGPEKLMLDADEVYAAMKNDMVAEIKNFF
jgi:YHS domain-containing protein